MSPLHEAMRRLDALRREVADLELFVSMYHRLSAGDQTHHTKPVENSDTGVVESVDNTGGRRRRSTATTEIVAVMENIIRDAGRPMNRTDLVAPLEARDVHIAGADKARYLGTVLWRNRSIFRNLPGHGYWLKALPYAPAGYDPATADSGVLDAEADTIELEPLPDELSIELRHEYHRAANAVRGARIRNADEDEYADALYRVRQIENRFPEIMSGNQSAV